MKMTNMGAMCALKRRKNRTQDVQVDQRRFLAAFRLGGLVQAACDATNVPRSSVYSWRERDPTFKVAFVDATKESVERLEGEAYLRATVGQEQPIIWKGQMQMVGLDAQGRPAPAGRPDLMVRQIPLTTRTPSDALLMFILKARRPQKYRDRMETKIGKDGAGDAAIMVRMDV